MGNKILKNKIFLGILFVLVLFGAAHQIIFSKTHIKEVPMLMATMRAKEFCSCYFILNKGKEYCLNSIKKGYPLFDYEIDEQKKVATFKNPMAEASAYVTEMRYGCSLR
jgi:hypothetical protein